MPYIKQCYRPEIDKKVDNLAHQIAFEVKCAGDKVDFLGILNYTVTKLIQEVPKKLVVFGVMKKSKGYWIMAAIKGVLGDVILEYNRRYCDPYETEKMIENGDVGYENI